MLFGKKSGNGSEAKHEQPEAPAASRPAGESKLEDAKKRLVAAKQMAAAFGEIVTLLMRSPADKHHSLGDLEWLVVPAVALGHYALAEAQSKETGAVSPVGAVLWAFVSEDVDKRLSDLAAPLRLKPNEWRSGNIPWIVLATGDMRVLAGLIQQLTKTTFKDQAPKMRARGSDGKVTVGRLEVKDKAAADA
jgi:hemolysin-activating ACP:hemolysin acyltransferase